MNNLTENEVFFGLTDLLFVEGVVFDFDRMIAWITTEDRLPSINE